MSYIRKSDILKIWAEGGVLDAACCVSTVFYETKFRRLFFLDLSTFQTRGTEAHFLGTSAGVHMHSPKINPPAVRSFGSLTVPLAAMTVDTKLIGHMSFSATITNSRHKRESFNHTKAGLTSRFLNARVALLKSPATAQALCRIFNLLYSLLVKQSRCLILIDGNS